MEDTEEQVYDILLKSGHSGMSLNYIRKLMLRFLTISQVTLSLVCDECGTNIEAIICKGKKPLTYTQSGIVL